MSSVAADPGDLFNGGPTLRLQRAVGLIAASKSRVVWRAILVVATAWLPLLLLAWIDGGSARVSAFFDDYAVHARYFIAAPLLVLAEAICIPQLGILARHFVEDGIVPPSMHGRFRLAIESTRKLRDTWVAEIAVIVLAYAAVLAAILLISGINLPVWHRGDTAARPSFSAAGWWHVLVSVPLLIALFFGWLWRLFLWVRFLRHVSQMDLRLVASHPDGVAGLGFLALSARSFAILGASIGVVAAGRTAERVVHHGHLALNSLWLVAGILILVALLFIGPLLVFLPVLLQAWRRGVFEYGKLASTAGRQFERKWLAGGDDRNMLETPDFSATTDLYQVVANAQRMRSVPIDLASIAVLLGWTLAPFVPALLMIVPFRAIVDEIVKLLF